MDSDFIKKLEEAIEANLSDPAFGVEELVHHSGISRSGLLKKVRSITGKSLSQLIREYRLKKALEMLQTEDLTVFEVAEKTGFSSAAYFATSFRKHFGYSPGKTIVQQNTPDSIEPHPNVSLNGDVPNHNKIPPSRIALFGGVLVVVLATAVLIVLSATGRLVKENSIAVLPFRINSQNAETATLTEILWEEVITTLAQVEVFDVRPAVSSGKYKDTEDRPIKKIGRALRVQYIIEGSVTLEGDQLKFWMQLINAKKDFHNEAEEYTFKLSELRDKMVELAEHTAYKLNSRLKPNEKSAIRIRCSKSTEAI